MHWFRSLHDHIPMFAVVVGISFAILAPLLEVLHLGGVVLLAVAAG